MKEPMNWQKLAAESEYIGPQRLCHIITAIKTAVREWVNPNTLSDGI